MPVAQRGHVILQKSNFSPHPSFVLEVLGRLDDVSGKFHTFRTKNTDVLQYFHSSADLYIAMT